MTTTARAEMPRHDRGIAFLAPLDDLEGCVEWLRAAAVGLPSFARFLLPQHAERWPDPTVRAMSFVRDGFRVRPGSSATVQRYDFAKAGRDFGAGTLVMVDFLPFVAPGGATDAGPWGVRLQRTDDDQLRGEASCNSGYFDGLDVGEAESLVATYVPSARVESF